MTYDQAHLDRLLQILRVVAREAAVLSEVRTRLNSSGPIDRDWVRALPQLPQRADMVESFAAKFGRMQDTIGDKLIPTFLRLVGENPGTAIDNINRCERLGLVPNALNWLEMRALRNKLVHEYMEEAEFFADAIKRAETLATDLLDSYGNIESYCINTLKIEV